MTQLETFIGQVGEQAPSDAIDRALRTVREHLGMEVAYLSEFVEGRSVFRAVDAPGLEALIKPGDSRSLDDVYCRHICEGRLPRLIPDTGAEPLAVSMPITTEIPIGSHVSVPIRRDDGSVYGMFCCLSPRPNPTLNQRDLDVMELFAGLSADQVNGAMAERLRRERIEAAIAGAMSAGAFRMVFQPIFDLGTPRPSGYEALCRFTAEPYRSPDKWFAEAEEVGLGLELELAVVAAALEALESLPPDVYVSVNAAPATLASGRLADVFAGRPLERIVLEITEHAAFGDCERLAEEARLLRFRGVKLAIDDAGAGYSGLQQIVRLSPDIITLDMSLTTGLDRDAAKRSLTAAMVHFAAETGAVIIAEGIETAEEFEALRTLGVQRGQGWLLGKPMPLDEAVGLCSPAPVARAG